MSETKAKIIKKSVSSRTESSVGEASSSLIESEVYDASQVAKDLVQKAQRQADEITAKALEEREKVLKDAYDEGYQQGLAKATEYVVQAKSFHQRAAESSKNDIKLLAIRIAEKIVGKSLELKPDMINDIVVQALRTLRQQKNVIVRCHEKDLEVLKKNEKEFLEQLGQGGIINFVEDSKISRGGCLVESEIGVVDARLETQLKTLQKVLLSK